MEHLNKFSILLIFTVVFAAIYCNQLKPESAEVDSETVERLARKIIPDEEAANKTLKELNADFFIAREKFINASLAPPPDTGNGTAPGANGTAPAPPPPANGTAPATP